MTDDFSEEAIRAHCPHCKTSSQAFQHQLEATDDFFIVCDAHPLIEGHILIIPRQHLVCIGDYSEELLQKFLELDAKVTKFVLAQYGKVASFEHGKFAQTVFHSHVHYLSFGGEPAEIVPEGLDPLRSLKGLDELKGYYEREGGYLFFSIGDRQWVVDPRLTKPRFFRDRFAAVLGFPERADWKAVHNDPKLFADAQAICQQTKQRWDTYFLKRNR